MLTASAAQSSSAAGQSASNAGSNAAAAALVELSGASVVTVDNVQQSVPPTLAAASSLLSELADKGGLSPAEQGGVYALFDRWAVLALTS